MAANLFQFLLGIVSLNYIISRNVSISCKFKFIGNRDGDGVHQGPERKQIAHLSHVAEGNLVIGTFTKMWAGFRKIHKGKWSTAGASKSGEPLPRLGLKRQEESRYRSQREWIWFRRGLPPWSPSEIDVEIICLPGSLLCPQVLVMAPSSGPWPKVVTANYYKSQGTVLFLIMVL